MGHPGAKVGTGIGGTALTLFYSQNADRSSHPSSLKNEEDDDNRFLSFAKLTFFLFINFFFDVVSLMTRVDSMFRSPGTSSVQWNLKMFLNLFWISHSVHVSNNQFNYD